MLTRIPVNEPINANLNSCTTRAIIERINPIEIDLGRLHAHRWIVSRGLHANKLRTLWNCSRTFSVYPLRCNAERTHITSRSR
ncbi:MAG: hypothetical protein FD135_4504 [Comamonadaceae bacterium]|nr:MAG: hypothetical protein FD135_4504 [Comamonadaceae bacterium]